MVVDVEYVASRREQDEKWVVGQVVVQWRPSSAEAVQWAVQVPLDAAFLREVAYVLTRIAAKAEATANRPPQVGEEGGLPR